jgi:ATP-dependent helicase/nuclease subunit B
VKARGARHLALAHALERPGPRHATSGGGRPTPRPPLDLRPTRLSVTRIELLRRDPYSIYAESILGLKPLDPVGPEAGIRESGILLHEVIARFSGSLGADVPPDANQVLHAMARDAFAGFLRAPDFRTFQWPRIMTALDAYVRWERERRGGIAKLLLERKGSLTLRLRDGSDFTLTAEADRIEQWRDGTLVVLDFKSGRVPSQKEVAAGFAPQLVLEAAMLKRGAFPEVDLREVSRATYVKLGGEDGLTPTDIGGRQVSLADLVPDQFEGLIALIEQFRDPDTAYVSRPYPQFVTRYGRYDHLARVREWSSTIEEG